MSEQPASNSLVVTPQTSRGLRQHLPRLAVGVLVAALVLGGMLWYQRRAASIVETSAASGLIATPVPVVTVTVQKAAYETLSQDIAATGSIAATDMLTVTAPGAGLTIETVLVDQGSLVKSGQILATLDSSILRAQLATAQGRLEESRASGDRAEQPNRPDDIAAQRSGVAQARDNANAERANLALALSTLANDEINAARYHSLLKQGYATVQETQAIDATVARDHATVAAARSRIAAADHAVAQARSRLAAMQAGGTSNDVRIARAQEQQSAGGVDQLRAQLADTIIRAPDAGLIITRDAHIGDVTSPTRPLFIMVRQGRLELDASVPESDLVLVEPGNPVTIVTQAGRITGKVFQISPSIDPQTRMGTVRIRVPLGPGIRTGMFAQGTIHSGSRRALTVPTSAVLGTQDQRFVYLLDHGHARRRGVKAEQVTGTTTEIVSGLAPGDPVIVAGAGFVNDGDLVGVH